MPRVTRALLVDTNVIIEAHRTECWRALAGRFPVETVAECVTETQTGFQRRRPEQMIDEAALRASLARIHDVGPAVRADAFVRDPFIRLLDAGESDLWAHALTRADAWILSGPDKASLRFGVRLGFRDRLVALETLLDDIGHRPHRPVGLQYTRRWHQQALAEIALSDGKTSA